MSRPSFNVKYVPSRAFHYVRKRTFRHLKKFPTYWKKNCHMDKLRKIPSIATSIPYYFKGLLMRLQLGLQNMTKASVIIQLFGYASNIVLLVALGMGLYTRWHYTEDNAILFIAFAGLFVFSISAALVYYFSKHAIGFSLSRLYIGCILGVISFTEHSTFHSEVTEEAMNILLMASLVMRCFWSVVERIISISKTDSVIVDSMDAIEMLGMAVASVVTGKEVVPISLLLLSLLITVTSIRLKSYLGVVNFMFLVIIAGLLYFPKLLHLSANPFALICFAGRMSFEPIIDLYFSRLSTLERWRPLFFRSPIVRKLLILFIFTLQITYLAINAKQIPKHKEWFIVIPIFSAFGFVWLSYHLVFFITCWLLSNKITLCITTYNNLSEENRNLNQIMASKGVRHFSLISQRLVLVTLVTTVILGAIGWNTKTALSISLLCMVIPVESAVMSLLWEMGSVLGGTCIGYALVAPAINVKEGKSVSILPTGSLQHLSSRATHILNSVQRFFSYHLIETYGCDYSSSGLTPESVRSKLKAFFERKTSDGPMFDTYLLYYSGSVLENGDWALSGNNVFKLNDLIEIWNEEGFISGNRLILVLDTDHSHRWARQIRALLKQHVAIQTCVIRKTGVMMEEGESVGIGNFTSDWMDYNGANLNDVDIHNKDRAVKLIYSVSKSWSEFTFRLPTKDDIVTHWNANFPKITRPLIKVTNFPKMNSLCFCCGVLIWCLKRLRMSWFPPAEYDTGHGFKLVRT